MPAPRNRRVHSLWDSPGRADLHLEVPDWTKNALCAEIGVEVFFGEKQGDQSGRLAKQACTRCPVKTQCLEWALTFEPWQDMYGVFGGTGPRERRAIRLEREQHQAGVAA